MREEGIVDGLFWAPHVGQKRNRPLDEEIIIDFQDVCHRHGEKSWRARA